MAMVRNVALGCAGGDRRGASGPLLSVVELTRCRSAVIIESMDAEESTALRSRAAVHAALSDPARLQIVDRLLLGDASPSALAAGLGIGSNLLAHHLGVLQAVRLIDRSQSQGDRRRTYVRLTPQPLVELIPAVAASARRVLFVCTRNSARSQLAAAAWRRRSTIPSASAGTLPAARVHPQAISAGSRRGLRLGQARTAHISDVLTRDDLVVVVCDNAYEELEGHQSINLHWSLPDPVRVGTDDAFDRVIDDIEERVSRLAAATTSPT